EPNTLRSWFVDEFRQSHGVMLEATSLLPETAGGLSDWRNHALIGVLVCDRGEGWVEPRNGSVRLHYDLDPADDDALRFGAERATDVLSAAGAIEVRPPTRTLTAYHPLGTVPLG